jgi:hypothetical protein
MKGDSSHSVEGLPSFDVAQRLVDRFNWISTALVFLRALLPQIKARPELAQIGV